MRFNTPAILVLLAIILLCVICGFTFARKLKLKQAGCAVIIAATFIFRLFTGLGSQFSIERLGYTNESLIPFSGIISLPIAASQYITGFVSSFVFALSLGILLPVLLSKKTDKGKLTVVLCTALAVELVVALLNLFGISMGAYFDTACILFCAAGCLLGFYIYTLVKKMRNGGKK